MMRMKRKYISILITCVMVLSCTAFCTACGASDGSASGIHIEGELQDILAQVYENANLDAEFRESLQYYMTDTLTEENEQAILGAADVSYQEGIYSVPMMSSIAYQCVLLRVEQDDVESVKAALSENADVNKWVCVSAETVLVENVGDLVLFIMSGEDVAYAVSESFQALGK